MKLGEKLTKWQSSMPFTHIKKEFTVGSHSKFSKSIFTYYTISMYLTRTAHSNLASFPSLLSFFNFLLPCSGLNIPSSNSSADHQPRLFFYSVVSQRPSLHAVPNGTSPPKLVSHIWALPKSLTDILIPSSVDLFSPIKLCIL